MGVIMKVEIPREQLIYAKVLRYGTIISLVTISVAYIVYIAEISPRYIEFGKLMENWGKKTHEFVKETNYPTGWSWLGLLWYGEFINLLLLAILAFLPLICYLAIIPIFVAKRDVIYLLIAIAEVIVLLLAASGVIAVGH